PLVSCFHIESGSIYKGRNLLKALSSPDPIRLNDFSDFWRLALYREALRSKCSNRCCDRKKTHDDITLTCGVSRVLANFEGYLRTCELKSMELRQCTGSDDGDD